MRSPTGEVFYMFILYKIFFASLMSEKSYECSRLTWSYNVSAIEFPNQFAHYMYCAHVLGIIYYH